MRLALPDAEATRTVGRCVGRILLANRGVPRVIALLGDLGAGKTTFVSGVLAGMGLPGVARSPTYTLVEPYDLDGQTVYHLDLYRLSGPADVEGLGLGDLHGPDATLLIEWAGRGAGALPPVDLELHFAYAGETARTVTGVPMGATGDSLLRQIRDSVEVQPYV